MATSQHFVNWVAGPHVSPRWLRLIFSAERAFLHRIGRGSVHKTVYFPQWRSMFIALPPLSEQLRIAEEAERRLSLASTAASTVEANRRKATLLLNLVIEKAIPVPAGSNRPSQDPELNMAESRKEHHKPNPQQTFVMRARPEDTPLISTTPLIEIINQHQAGITPEKLFVLSGYFTNGDPDGFYRELCAIRAAFEQDYLTPDGSSHWPEQEVIILRPRKEH